MPDNTGPYISRGQLAIELGNAGEAVATPLVLSAKATTVAPAAKFTFSPAAPAPVVGDWVKQGAYAQKIISLPTATEVELEDGTNIVNGSAELLKGVPADSAMDSYIAQAMAFIDRHTRQWFNARAGVVKIPGNNSQLAQLQVPIISVSQILLNGNQPPLDLASALIFNGRFTPDDRRNPRIILRRANIDIFALEPRILLKDRITEITGVWGYLEADGSTPLLIQRATAKLAVMRKLSTAGSSAVTAAGSAGLGPIASEKTDMHEISYHDPRTSDSASLSSGTGLSGDDEIDDIIVSYRSAIIIGGSMPDVGARTETGGWWSNNGGW